MPLSYYSRFSNFFNGWWFNRLIWLSFYYTKILHFIIPKYIYGFVAQGLQLYSFAKVYCLPFILTFLKSNSLIRLATLIDLFAVDYPKSSDGRFILIYCFWSYFYSFRFIIKVFINFFCQAISISSFFLSSGWFEREIWDLFGIKFIFHNDLRRILTDYGFSGHPLRKEFPLVGFLELRYDDSYSSLVFEPIELSQELRFYFFFNPWNTTVENV